MELVWKGNDIWPVSVLMVDMMGRVVMQHILREGNGQLHHPISLEGITCGIYMVIIKDEKGSVLDVGKVVVQ